MRLACLAALLLGGAAGIAAAQGTEGAAATVELTPWARERVTACGTCHGADGVATLPKVPSLAGQPKLFVENRLVIIREGLSPIPEMKGMLDSAADADLIALARHFAALPMPAARPARNEAQAQRGATLATRMLCGTCHLPDHVGREQVPRLAGQREDYLRQSMQQFRDGKAPGRDTLMTNALMGTSDADIADLAHHLATQR